MRKQKESEPSLEELLETVNQISLLIEDNNQNMRDCYKILKQIQKQVCPKPRSLFSRAVSKLLNRK